MQVCGEASHTVENVTRMALIAMQWANADSSNSGSGSSGDSGSGSGSEADSGDADSDADDGPAVSAGGAAASPSAAAASRGRDSGHRPKLKRRKGAKALKQGQKRQLQRMEISDASDDGAGGDSGADSEPASDAGMAPSRLALPWCIPIDWALLYRDTALVCRPVITQCTIALPLLRR